jgi:hypothetical protein
VTGEPNWEEIASRGLDLPPPDALDNLLGTREFGVLIESAVKPTTSGNSGCYSSRR